MALNDVVFVKGQGGLGRPLTGSDHISGFLFFSAAYPSGFDSSNKVKQVFSVADAEALGIVDTYTDETPAEAEYEVTAVGSNGDTVKIEVVEPNIDGSTTTVNLGTYTKVSGDTTAANVATAIGLLINNGTLTHGYSATVDTATVTIIARDGLGIALNSGTPVVVTETGTIAGTLTQFTGGAYSKLALMHYQISEYFRMQPKGNLYIGVFPVPATYDFAEIQTMQNFAQGNIRQLLAYNTAARSVTEIKSDTTAIQTILDTLEGVHKRLEAVIYAANIAAVSDLSTMQTLQSLTNENVSIEIGQDGGGLGALLYLTSGVSVPAGGATLGAVSLAKVSDNIGWVQKFNFSNGVELETLAFANGDLYTDISESLLEQLNTYRYMFLRKHVGLDGSYANDSHTCIIESSDYAYIENNRTIGKAIRQARTALLPLLNSPLLVNTDGTMTVTTIETFKNALRPSLDQMERNAELSNYQILIDPDQNVVSTSEVAVTIELQPVGVARRITVNIGFVASITTTV